MRPPAASLSFILVDVELFLLSAALSVWGWWRELQRTDVKTQNCRKHPDSSHWNSLFPGLFTSLFSHWFGGKKNPRIPSNFHDNMGKDWITFRSNSSAVFADIYRLQPRSSLMGTQHQVYVLIFIEGHRYFDLIWSGSGSFRRPFHSWIRPELRIFEVSSLQDQ